MFCRTNVSGIDTSDANAIADSILAGYSGYVNGAKVLGAMPGAPTYPVEWSALDMHVYSASPNPTQGNHNVFFRVPKGYYNDTYLGFLEPDLTAANLKVGTVVGGGASIVGTFTADANALATHLLVTKTMYVNGNLIDGSMRNRSAENYWMESTVGGSYDIPQRVAYLQPPEGYYDGATLVYKNEPDLTSDNIILGKTILNRVGGAERVKSPLAFKNSAGAEANYAYACPVAEGYALGSPSNGTITIKNAAGTVIRSFSSVHAQVCVNYDKFLDRLLTYDDYISSALTLYTVSGTFVTITGSLGYNGGKLEASARTLNRYFVFAQYAGSVYCSVFDTNFNRLRDISFAEHPLLNSVIAYNDCVLMAGDSGKCRLIDETTAVAGLVPPSFFRIF